MKKFAALCLLFITVIAPQVARAQEGFTAPRDSQPPNLVSCFDYYHFGSVEAVIEPSLTKAAQGSVLAFTGTVSNENTYPVPDVEVWGKLFRVKSTEKDINGPDVLAWIPLAGDMNLRAGETRPISFEVPIPPDAEPGTYQVATYVTNLDRFELSGLTFTDDIIGNKAEFEVVGENTGAIRFGKDGVTVNEGPFYFAAFPPSIPAGMSRVPVTARVDNSTDTPFKGTVTWELYYWDAFTTAREGGTLIKSSSEEVQIHPNASTTLSYAVDDREHSVYYLAGKLTNTEGEVISVIGVRFVRADINIPRFNFVTGTEPREGNNGAAVACIHSTGYGTVENGRVELVAQRLGPVGSILSMLGFGELARATYEGPIPGTIYALTAPLEARASSYVVTARLYQGDMLIDEVTAPYCEDGACRGPMLTYLIVGLVGVLIVAGLLFWNRRERNVGNQPVI